MVRLGVGVVTLAMAVFGGGLGMVATATPASAVGLPGLDSGTQNTVSPISAAADLCQHGGYALLVGTNGETFSNAGQCVSYAAHGGQWLPTKVTDLGGGPAIKGTFNTYGVDIGGN